MILTVPGGQLSSAQLKAIEKCAAEHGRGFADLTTGREIRIPGVGSSPPTDLLQALSEAGLSGRDSSLDAPAAVLEDPPEIQKDPIGVLEQPEAGLFTIGVPVLAGRLSGSQMRKAADVAERYGNGSLLLTPEQNLLIPGVLKDKVAQLLEGLDTVGLKVSVSPLRRALTCCAGEKAPAVDLVEYLEKQVPLDEPIRIHLSDSPCACSQARSAQIRLEGIETCDVTVGGFTAQAIPAAHVKYRIEKLLFGYKRGRKPEESFEDFCRRVGDEELAKMLAEDA